MKKKHKHEEPFVLPPIEPDIAGLIGGLREQIAGLERKIDTLINQGPKRSFDDRQPSPSFPRFDHGNRQPEGRFDGGYRERVLHKAVCADCGKGCEVPFKPSGERPVYCKECFGKRKAGSAMPFKERHETSHRDDGSARERRFEKRHFHEDRKSGAKKKPYARRKK